MAQYKTHAKFNLFIALPCLAIACYYLFHPSWTLLSFFSGCFAYGTLFMSPDMDLAHQIKFFSIRGILTSPFRLYSKLFSHRGLSHSILFGTLTRLLFLASISLLILYLINQTLPSTDTFLSFLKTHQNYLSYSLAGLFLADLCHLLLDI